MLNTTWFYTTNLKNYPELQETVLSDQKSKLPNKKSLIISGTVGVGKTHSAILLARDYCSAKYEEQACWHYSFEPCFISFFEFIKILNDQKFGDETEKSEAFYSLRIIKESPFLIIDDLRASFTSEYEKTSVDNALLDLLSIIWANRRERVLIVTSNNTREEIEKAYSGAVCSRLFGLCEYVEVCGEDKRRIRVDLTPRNL